MYNKKESGGAEKVRQKKKLLLEAAGQAPNQKTLTDCFRKPTLLDNKSKTIDGKLLIFKSFYYLRPTSC